MSKKKVIDTKKTIISSIILLLGATIFFIYNRFQEPSWIPFFAIILVLLLIASLLPSISKNNKVAPISSLTIAVLFAMLIVENYSYYPFETLPWLAISISAIAIRLLGAKTGQTIDYVQSIIFGLIVLFVYFISARLSLGDISDIINVTITGAFLFIVLFLSSLPWLPNKKSSR